MCYLDSLQDRPTCRTTSDLLGLPLVTPLAERMGEAFMGIMLVVVPLNSVIWGGVLYVVWWAARSAVGRRRGSTEREERGGRGKGAV